MKLFLFSVLFLFSSYNYSQIVIEKYSQPEGYLRIGPEQEQTIPMVEKGFSLILPEVSEVNAVVVIPGDERINCKQAALLNGSLEYEALKKNLAILHIHTGNPYEFYFTNDIITDVTKRLQSILADNNLKGKPVYFSGTSLSGTRALKLAIFLQSNREKYWVQPSAAAIIDAPLDMVRFWDSENRTVINKFNKDAVDIGKLYTFLLKENLGTPEENFNYYVDYSPFVYKAKEGGNAKYLRNVPVRAYYDPDVTWWIDNHRKDLYSLNSTDMAGLINQLKLLNNYKAELKIFNRNNSEFSGDSSHYGIDYSEMMDWFLSFKY